MKYLLSSIILAILVTLTTFAQKAEVVYGKIIFNSTNATYPLASAKVLLCSKTDTVSGFTDNDGNIAFYNIKVNHYVLKTVFNADTLFVVLANNKTAKQKPLKIIAGNNNIGKVNVRKKE